MGLLRIDPGSCQRICDFPDDILLKILLKVPTKDALATQILSKRWRHVPKMLPQLIFKDDQGSESIGLFIDKSLQLHEAPILFNLTVQLGPPCHVDVDDVTKWVDKAINYHKLESLIFKLFGTAQPITLPMSLYTCKTLTWLILSGSILVHVSFPPSLPSLLQMGLLNVLYKDQDSLARLLSSSPVLEELTIRRDVAQDDNLTDITVKVPTLKSLHYRYMWCEEKKGLSGSLVIDCPVLTTLTITDYVGDYCCLLENMPCLDTASILYVPKHHDAKFLTYLSSAKRLHLSLSESMVESFNEVMFSRLIDLYVFLEGGVDWLESLILVLHNSPTLKTLTIDSAELDYWDWNQPSVVPECLSSQLEIVRWRDYKGNEGEKEVLAYILANSECLKTVEISPDETCNLEECQNELESMPRISTSSRLLYAAPKSYFGFYDLC